MGVRAKFYVQSIEYTNSGGTVKCHPVMGRSEENVTWSKATPSGELRMGILNEDALAFFKDLLDRGRAGGAAPEFFVMIEDAHLAPSSLAQRVSA